MKIYAFALTLSITFSMLTQSFAFGQEVIDTAAETKISGPCSMSIIVRKQGPFDADVPLQVVCYFERTASSDDKLFGAPVELDKRLGGLIASLRARGEFNGDELETLLVESPENTIAAKRLLLIGLGNEANLSIELMEEVGRAALREAVRTGAKQVAFAPMIKDAGNDALSVSDVENAVTRGMLLAYDTEMRLQSQGFATEFRLDTWIVEAGPIYFDDTIAGVRNAIAQAAVLVKQRDSMPYSTKSRL